MSPTQQDHGAPHQNGKSEGAESAYQTWYDFYRQMSEEGMNAFQKGIEASQNFSASAPFNAHGSNPLAANPIMNVWMESIHQFNEKMGTEKTAADSLNEFSNPEYYKKMYDAWTQTWGENLETYMKTSEFAEKSGKDLEKFSDLKAQMGKTLEMYWESIHLASSADMKELYHKLYQMDRKLDDLDKRFKNIEKGIETLLTQK
jgi:hypothetical protein